MEWPWPWLLYSFHVQAISTKGHLALRKEKFSDSNCDKCGNSLTQFSNPVGLFSQRNNITICYFSLLNIHFYNPTTKTYFVQVCDLGSVLFYSILWSYCENIWCNLLIDFTANCFEIGAQWKFCSVSGHKFKTRVNNIQGDTVRVTKGISLWIQSHLATRKWMEEGK